MTEKKFSIFPIESLNVSQEKYRKKNLGYLAKQFTEKNV